MGFEKMKKGMFTMRKSKSEQAPEIEITREMIEAGTLELLTFNPEIDSGTEFVKRVFQAMIAASVRTPQDS